MTKFQTKRRVEFCDTDMAGIVHFANFFRFMESAEVDFLQSLGLSVRMEWEGQHIGFPRVSASCNYLSPARFEDVLEIHVSLEKLGKKSATYLFEFFNNGTPIATGIVTSVCCTITDEHGLQSMEIPETLRKKLLEAG